MGGPKEAIILSGGLGTRLQEVAPDLPKPMAPVAGRPFLAYLFDYLKHFNFWHVVLSVGYKHKVIQDYFGHEHIGIHISYTLEEEPLGTGGGMRLAMSKVRGHDMFVLNGDTFFDVDLASMWHEHQQSGAMVSIALRKLFKPGRYGTVVLDERKRITAFKEKESRVRRGWINGGIYIIADDLFNQFDLTSKFSFEKDIMEKELQRVNIGGYPSDGYFIDIGIPEDYQRANREFERFKY